MDRQAKRDRVAEGRYQFHADEYRQLCADRRQLAAELRASGSSWQEIGGILGVSADAARKLASRARPGEAEPFV